MIIQNEDEWGISYLPDQDLVALTELRMERDADLRLSELLDRQQAGELTDVERTQLADLMKTYATGLLRQSRDPGRSG